MEKERSRRTECYPKKTLSSFVKGELDPQTEKDLVKHLSACKECSSKVIARFDVKDFFKTTKRSKDAISALEKDIISKVGNSAEEGEQVPTLWLMLNNAVMKEIKFRPGIPWTTELSKPGLYSLINQEKQILYELRKLPGVEKGVSVRGATDSIARPQIEVIKIPIQGKEMKGELAIKLERKKEQLVLSLSVKVPKR